MSIRLFIIGRLLLALLLGLPVAQMTGQVDPARAQVITVVLVEGNQRVEAETVRSYMQLSPGDSVDAQSIDESIKALFQTGLFSDVQIFRRGTALVVRVEENPLINRVSFEGNSELDDKTLAKEIEVRERVVFTRARVQAAVQRIIALYRRSGYFSARVEPKVIRLPQNRVNLVFEISEGTETKIASIKFVGNAVFSDGQLRSVITTAESAWWKFFSTTDNYDPDRLSYDKELLRRYYLRNGYADFRVISATAELARDGESFFITFTVEEGPQYTVGTVAVNTGQTTLDANELNNVVTTGGGEVYDASKVDKTVENMTIEAGKSGYAFAKVQPNIERDEENRVLNITFEVVEGPRVYIERIDIIGNVRTLDEVIRRELRLVEGDAYNRVLVDRARRRLTGLDFFSKIDIRELQGSAPDKVQLVIFVEEKSTGTINFSAGYSTTEQVIGSINVTERNFLGKGQAVRLATSLSFKRQSVDFSFTEPYFLGRNLSAGVDLFATRTDQEDESSFTTEQFGGGLRWGFPLSENGRIFARYKFTHRTIRVDNSDDVSLAIARAEGTDIISLAGVSYTWDTIDNPLRPTNGIRIQLSTDVAGLGGDVYWVKGEAKAFYFRPLFTDGIVLKLKGTAGHVEGFNNEEVPILDRFFRGAESFRGFERSGVGPRQIAPDGDSDSIGGQTYAIGTIEVTFPLGLPESFGITGAVFTDFGTVFNAPESSVPAGGPGCTLNSGAAGANCTVFDDASLRGSVGAGLLWQSPFGPLRLDVAWPFLQESYDRTELVRFSAGTRF